MELDSQLTEKHFTIGELAKHWRLSYRTVQDLCEGRDDIVRLANRKPGKREYVTLRIPRSVAMQIYAGLLKGGRQ